VDFLKVDFSNTNVGRLGMYRNRGIDIFWNERKELEPASYNIARPHKQFIDLFFVLVTVIIRARI
jgi:hypothetical protein